MKNRGVAVGLVCGVLLGGGAMAMMQPVKTKPKPVPVAIADVPEAVLSYVRAQAPKADLDAAEATVFQTGALTVYRVTSNQGAEVVDATLTDTGVLLAWKRQHTGGAALVPEQVKSHVRAALPGCTLHGLNDYDSILYIYTAEVEKDGAFYRVSLSSVEGLEIEEMADWQVSVLKRRLGKDKEK